MRLYGVGGKYVAKERRKGGGSGGMLPWEILMLNLLFDAIYWNLGQFTHKHNLPFICVIKAFIIDLHVK